MNFQFVEPWHLFLPREPGHVVGISGSGGKTSLLRRLGELYRTEGIPVVLTTTTRTEPLPSVPVLDLGEPDRAARDAELVFVRDGVDADGKWRGPDAGRVDDLEELLPGRVTLVETDGAGKKPLKLYRAGEPVWPERTSLALVVLGLHAFDTRADAALHRFGRRDVPQPDGLAPGTLIGWDHLETLLTGAGGYLDQVPPGIPAVVVLTGMGQVQDSIGLFDFMGRVMADPRVPLALLCEFEGDAPSLRTVCRREEPDTADR